MQLVNWLRLNAFKISIFLMASISMTISMCQADEILGLANHVESNKRFLDTEVQIQMDTLKGQTRKYSSLYLDTQRLLESTISRIDIIDSAVDPKFKRRKLIKNIRNAITDNTNRIISTKVLNRIANAVIDFSHEQNITMAIILAQMKQESDFDVYAESHAHAKGLMQILDHKYMSTANEIAGHLGYRSFSIFDIRTNIRFGCYYMSKMLTEFKTYEDALRAYNFGPHRVLELKAGNIDYSHSKTIETGSGPIKYLLDDNGNFLIDEFGDNIEVMEEHKYPAETIDYVNRVSRYRELFAKYGLDEMG